MAGSAAEIVRLQAQAWQQTMNGRARASTVGAAWKFGGWLVFTAGFAAGLAVVVDGTAKGAGTVGDLVMAVTVAATLRNTLHGAVTRTASVAQVSRFVEPLFWMRDHLAADRAHRTGTLVAPPVLTDGITFHDVGHTYAGTDRRALDGISVHLPAGSVVAVVGEYGSGKTTLVKVLAKFYRPDAGRVTVDGVDLADLETRAWRARISAAFQDFGRFATTFGQNVGLGDLPHLDDRERVAAAVREADADRVLRRLPDGHDTLLGRDVVARSCPRASGRKPRWRGPRCVPSRCCSSSTSRPRPWTRRVSRRSSSATWPAPVNSARGPERSASSSRIASRR